MRSKGTAAELEARRFRAVELLESGKSTTEVARLLGAGHSSVKRWKIALAKGGMDALAAKPHPGTPSKLSDDQKAQLVEILVAGPLASGYLTDPLDLSSRGRSRAKDVWCFVSPGPSRANLAQPGLYTSEAGAVGA